MRESKLVSKNLYGNAIAFFVLKFSLRLNLPDSCVNFCRSDLTWEADQKEVSVSSGILQLNCHSFAVQWLRGGHYGVKIRWQTPDANGRWRLANQFLEIFSNDLASILLLQGATVRDIKK